MQKSRLADHHNQIINSASFSPDSQSLVTSSDDHYTVVTDLLSGKKTLIHHEAQVKSASFSPDGRGLFFSTTDGAAGTLSLENVCVQDRIRIENTPAACVT